LPPGAYHSAWLVRLVRVYAVYGYNINGQGREFPFVPRKRRETGPLAQPIIHSYDVEKKRRQSSPGGGALRGSGAPSAAAPERR